MKRTDIVTGDDWALETRDTLTDMLTTVIDQVATDVNVTKAACLDVMVVMTWTETSNYFKYLAFVSMNSGVYLNGMDYIFWKLYQEIEVNK